ncbi:hypothetical protein IV500_05775 [Paeniglutamicibacter antarcticus]|uniref:Uncharacterized protein n=1 Tax=Arthrobacter terrae TaxID=2935737 RepID=A0A931CQ28_9MICC|nr:hypothetical protein [Arthrobacter terrae]MBG0738931.1 hypothetical protein [Arthrobacter terrae]
MSTLGATFKHRRPVLHRVTVLDTVKDVNYFTRTTDNYPDSNGTYRRHHKNFIRDAIVLEGAYFVEETDEDGDRTGRFEVLTQDEFHEKFTGHEEPSFEYGLQFIPRPQDVVRHGSLDAARVALEAVPVLKASGDYSIVRRPVPAPGPWERIQ